MEAHIRHPIPWKGIVMILSRSICRKVAEQYPLGAGSFFDGLHPSIGVVGETPEKPSHQDPKRIPSFLHA